MANPKDFEAVFTGLRSILQSYANRLTVITDQPNNYYLDAAYSEQYKKPMFFGAVQIKKNYVSYHLMALYIQPDLINDLSPELRKRMQGKSCFNFAKLDEKLLDELSALTKRGFELYVEQKWVV